MIDPGNIIVLPKPDKRYKRGHIAKDNRGQYRGHPDTVSPRFMHVGINQNYPTASSLNPLIIVTKELGDFVEDNI